MENLYVFKEVWVVDWEFRANPGDVVVPICLVAYEVNSKRVIRLNGEDLQKTKEPPYSVGTDSVMVAYFASAEISCHLALGWDLPSNVIDLYVEFRNRTNGSRLPCGSGLLGALAFFGLGAMSSARKDAMRELVISTPTLSAEQQAEVLDYCEEDVMATAELLRSMVGDLDVARAALRGRYMRAVALMEHTGIPLDVESLGVLDDEWEVIVSRLVLSVDPEQEIFEGARFSAKKFQKFLAAREISWPLLASGRLELRDETFKLMAGIHPEIAPIREVRRCLSKMRLADLSAGADGRNRTLLSPFRARTSRNQPSNTKFVFGPAKWIRGLVKPPPGNALVYLDWCQQEFGIAAALSGDERMMCAYESGDPYLAFAKQAGAVPADASRNSHPKERERFKQCALGVQYGMGAKSLALRIGDGEAAAHRLLELHRAMYPKFWSWSDAAVDRAMLKGNLQTVFGWRIQAGSAANPRMLRNFPMQANGAEMLRLACCLALENGVSVCAPVHDALLIQSDFDGLKLATKLTQDAMLEASRVVLDGFALRSDCETVRYPDRLMEPGGVEMWNRVWSLLGDSGRLVSFHA